MMGGGKQREERWWPPPHHHRIFIPLQPSINDSFRLLLMSFIPSLKPFCNHSQSEGPWGVLGVVVLFGECPVLLTLNVYVEKRQLCRQRAGPRGWGGGGDGDVGGCFCDFPLTRPCSAWLLARWWAPSSQKSSCSLLCLCFDIFKCLFFSQAS